MTETNLHDRYPGARPFADTEVDHRLFFGREQEINDLFYQVLSTDLLVLFGKSGLGKTSLLQAGLFPRLREKELLPLPVRLNHPELEPLQLFLPVIAALCEAEGIDYTPGETGGLWEFFKTAVFWRGDALQTPVLVLDQFEELFTLQSVDNRQRIARELGELLSGGLPQRLRARLQAGEKLPYSDKPPAVKIVLSLREDYLGALQALVGEIPRILENRFRLTALGRIRAEQAVVRPAGLSQAGLFVTAPFEYDPAAVAEMLTFLEGKTGEIEPFQLQVLCRQVEQRVQREQAQSKQTIRVDASYLGGRAAMQRILQNFYLDAIRCLPTRRMQKRARRLCEEGLLSPEGYRISLEEKQIAREFKVNRLALEKLVDTRLLRKEARLESFYYELSHDSLVQPVLESRPWRMPRWMKLGVYGIVGVLCLAIAALALLDWQKRQVEAHAERARQAREEAEGVLNYLVYGLRDKLEPIGRLDLMEDVTKQVDAYYERMGIEGQDAKVVVRRAEAYNNQGDILLHQGKLQGAQQAYQGALKLIEELVQRDPDDTGLQRELSVSHNKLGNVLRAQGDLGGAQWAYQASLAIRERLAAQDPSNAQWQRDLASSYDKIGDALRAQGDLDGAQRAYQAGLAIRERLAVQDPSNAQWQQDLSTSHEEIGEVLAVQGDLGGAQRAYQAGLAIRERLTAQDPRNMEWQRDLSISHERIGEVLSTQGYLGEAQRAYQAGLAIRERLAVQDPSNAQWQQDLSLSHDNVGDVLRAQGNLGGSQRAYQASLAIAERLAAQDPSNAQWQQNLSLSHDNVGDVLRAQGDLGGAQWAYQASLAIRERLAAQDPSNAHWQRDLSVSRSKIGDMLAEQGDLAGAQRAYQASLAIRERLATQEPRNMEWQRDLSISYNKVGGALAEQRDLAGAQRAYQASLAIRERLAAQDPSNARWQRDLSVSHDRIGDVLAEQGDLGGARRAHQASLAIRERLAAQDPSNAHWQQDLSLSHNNVGDVLRAQGDLAGAQRAYQASLAIAERLAAQDPSNAQWQRDLSVSHDRIGDVLARQGDLGGAQRAYQASLAIRERLAAQDPSNALWQRDLTISYSRISRILVQQQDDYAGAVEATRKRVAILETLIERQPQLKPEAAGAYGSLAWYELFNRRPEEAIAAAQRGLELDASQVLINTSLAHSYLFTGHYEQAEAIYLKYKDIPVNEQQTFAAVVLDDFRQFRERGLNHPDMDKIERLLGGTKQ